ncbi:MAG TPA: hypothetical protein VNO30_03960 [Kofleriaceae bacterium]|nr:hypothetical protein [Kofleriaceae bacterium]
MKLGLALPCALTAACGFSSPKLSDRPSDAPVIDPDVACMSFSTQLDTCPLPTGFPTMLAGTLLFDTDTGKLKDANQIEIPVVTTAFTTLGVDMRAIVATSLELMPNTTLTAQGVRGFALIATSTIALRANAVIDVSNGGAGYRSLCGAESPGAGADNNDGGAGGGGAGLGAAGGGGGNGNGDGTQSLGGTAGAALAPPPEGPRGGCTGGPGGRGDSGQNVGGAGGLGGGAVYVVSASSITIATGAGIDAGGGGGSGGTRVNSNGDAGGGGGGSGGSIFLETPRILSDGIIAANGGGGGEGSGGGVPGQPGAPATFGTAAAIGGQTSTGSGARGGDGGALASPAGAQTTELLAGGGGGGGGGGGVIRVKSADAQLGTNVSPAASIQP